MIHPLRTLANKFVDTSFSAREALRFVAFRRAKRTSKCACAMTLALSFVLLYDEIAGVNRPLLVSVMSEWSDSSGLPWSSSEPYLFRGWLLESIYLTIPSAPACKGS